VEANIPDLLPMLEQALTAAGITYGLPVVARYGRVAIADQLGHALNAKLAVNLIGERPGLSSATSLSAYLTYNPGPNTISSDRTVVSNIHSRGTPPVEAGAYVAALCRKILDLKVSGVRLQQMS
jgi:ethanolamine ammonia-lyase small subunit